VLVFDRKTIPWALLTVALAAGSVVAFAVGDARAGPRGASGGSTIGLGLGIAAFAMLLVALLLGMRKRYRTLRVGKAYAWMQAHVWLGALSYPVAYLHAGGFHWGSVGSLTWVMMLAFTVVWASGLIGLALQQVVPRVMFDRVPREVTIDQHAHVLRLMREEAAARIAQVGRPADGLRVDLEAVPAGTATTAVVTERSSLAAESLRGTYEQEIVPFLADRVPRRAPLRSASVARLMFAELRGELPAEMHGIVADLEQLADERRQMLAQATMHRALHWWLFTHVPLSYALAALVALHAVFAFRYVR
jgi:hypothetical protein